MARDAVGCLGAMALTIVFYILLAVALITLVIYPIIYVSDAFAVDSYSRVQVCASASNADCRSVVEGRISNVHTDLGRLNFNFVSQIGVPTGVEKESGAYTPQNGDVASAQFWRSNPVLVTGPEGTSLVTTQDPQARLRGDEKVFWLFLVGGSIVLGGAAAIGWFGRRIIFVRLIGYRRLEVAKGFGLLVAIIAIAVASVLLGKASGGWLGTRAGGLAIASAIGLAAVGATFIYRRVRRAR
jgi:hypothetical protein